MKGVEDALRRLDGVGSIAVDLQTNLVRVRPAVDVELDLAALPRAIRRAGFTPGELRVVARGELLELGGTRVFRIRGWRCTFPVDALEGVPPGELVLRARVELSGPEPRLVAESVEPATLPR